MARRATATAKRPKKSGGTKRSKRPEPKEEIPDALPADFGAGVLPEDGSTASDPGAAPADGSPEHVPVDGADAPQESPAEGKASKKGKGKKAAKGPKKKERTPEQFRAAVLRAEGAREVAREALESVASKHKEAKATYERASDALHELIRTEKDDGGPLFAAQSDEGWRRASMTEVFGDKLGKLVDGKLKPEIGSKPTLEKLVAWLDNRDVTAIPGVGEATGKKLEDALADFWKRHPEWCDAAKEAAKS